MKYSKSALKVSGMGEKIGTDWDEKQVMYFAWPYQSFLSTIYADSNPR